MSALVVRPINDVEPEALNGFSCGNADLDKFLCEFALDYSKAGLTQTMVVFLHDDTVPAAFFSLSADGMPMDFAEKNNLCLAFDCAISYFPAVKITRLAVRTDLQGSGIGADLIEIIEGLAYSPNVSVRLLTVDAINIPRALAFYGSNGFRTSSRNVTRQKIRRRDGLGEATRSVLMYRDLYAPEEESPPASRWGTAAGIAAVDAEC